MGKTAITGYADDDLRQIKTEIDEALEKERVAKQAASEKRKREVQAIWNRAQKLGMPVNDAKRAFKLLRMQERLDEAADSLPDDSAETVADMVKALGEFGDTPLGRAAVQAVDDRLDKARVHQEAEQREGAEVLDSIAAVL
jgi:hypothetical protein